MSKWRQHELQLNAYLEAIESRAEIAQEWAKVTEWDNKVAISEAKACKACKDKMRIDKTEAHSATLAEQKQLGIRTPTLVKIMNIDPDECLAFIAELEGKWGELQARIERLEARIARLRACKECYRQSTI